MKTVMLGLATICLAILATASVAATPSNTTSSVVNKLIIGGQEAPIQFYPYLAHVEYLGFVCSATIISTVWLITAGICFKWHEVMDDWIIVAATSRLDNYGHHHRVIRWIQHPRYDRNSQDYDFALLCSASPMTWPEVSQPVSIPIQDSPTPAGGRAIIAGWGQVYPEIHEMSNRLHTARLYTYSDAACKVLLGDRYTPRKLCAKQYRGGVSVASNDAGGPLVVNQLLYGVTIPKLNDYYQDIYGVKQFARISSVTDWIINVTEAKYHSLR